MKRGSPAAGKAALATYADRWAKLKEAKRLYRNRKAKQRRDADIEWYRIREQAHKLAHPRKPDHLKDPTRVARAMKAWETKRANKAAAQQPTPDPPKEWPYPPRDPMESRPPPDVSTTQIDNTAPLPRQDPVWVAHGVL